MVSFRLAAKWLLFTVLVRIKFIVDFICNRQVLTIPTERCCILLHCAWVIKAMIKDTVTSKCHELTIVADNDAMISLLWLITV